MRPASSSTRLARQSLMTIVLTSHGAASAATISAPKASARQRRTPSTRGQLVRVAGPPRRSASISRLGSSRPGSSRIAARPPVRQRRSASIRRARPPGMRGRGWRRDRQRLLRSSASAAIGRAGSRRPSGRSPSACSPGSPRAPPGRRAARCARRTSVSSSRILNGGRSAARASARAARTARGARARSRGASSRAPLRPSHGVGVDDPLGGGLRGQGRALFLDPGQPAHPLSSSVSRRLEREQVQHVGLGVGGAGPRAGARDQSSRWRDGGSSTPR